MKQFNQKDFEYWKSIYAQDMGQQSIDEQNQMLNLAKSLLTRISGDVNTGAAQDPNVTSLSTLGVASETPINLKAENLTNLRTLIGYLATQNIAWKGQLIAGIKGKQNDPLKNNVAGGAADVDTLTSRVSPDQLKNYKPFPNTTHLFVNANSLKSYLIDLKSQAVNSGNQLFIVMVDGIIDEANKTYSFGIKDGEQNKESFDPETILDQLPKVINLNDLKGPGNVILKLKDLENSNSFVSWITSKQIAITDGKSVQKIDDTALICKLIGYLWERSKALNIKLTKEFTEYTKRMEALGQAYSCPVSGGSNKPIQTSDQKITEISEELKKAFSAWVFPLMDNKFSRTQVNNFINAGFSLIDVATKAAAKTKNEEDKKLSSILNSIGMKTKLTSIFTSLQDMQNIAGKNWNELRLDTGIPNISESIYREKVSSSVSNPMLAAKKTVLLVIQCIDGIQEIFDGFKDYPELEKTFDENKIANQLQLANYQTNILRNVYDTGLDNLNAKIVGTK